MESILFGSVEEKHLKIALLSHLDSDLYLFRLPEM